MERAKQIAITFFESLGYVVQEIPVAHGKRADLKVSDGKCSYVVEVKEKLEADSQAEYSTIEVPDSLVYVRQEAHARSNRIDGVLKRGAKQLSETPCADGAFKLVWLHSEGDHAEMTARRALYTYYGIADLVPQSQRGNGVNCVYFHYSTAFAKPNVNGLIVVEDHSLQLCLNEFSDNYGSFKKSSLVRNLGEAVYDPLDFEKKASTIVLRSTISRGRESEVLDEVERTTGIRYRMIKLNRYTFS